MRHTWTRAASYECHFEYRSFVNAKHAKAKYAAGDTSYDDYDRLACWVTMGPSSEGVGTRGGEGGEGSRGGVTYEAAQ